MSQLLYVISGWLGMFSRVSLLLQVAVGVGLLLVYRAWKLRYRPSAASWQPVVAKVVMVVVMALASALLVALGWPGGLLALMAQLVAIWTGLSALRLVLRRWILPAQVEGYWRRAVLPLFVVLALGGAVHRLDGIEAISQAPLLKLFDQPLNFGTLLLLIGLPYFLVVLSELPVFLVGSLAGRLAGLELGNRKAFELIFRYLLVGLGTLWLADRVGLNSTAIAAVAGGLSVGLGFGVKEVFSNFVSGIWLLFEGSVKPGDVLVHQGDVCQVTSLGLRAATLLRTMDNAELVVPNQNFFTATSITYTGSDSLRNGFLVVRADYSHDPEQVIAILVEIAKANSMVLPDPEPSASLMNFGDYAIEYGLSFWMQNPLKNGSICSQLRRAIWQRFQQEGIEIPLAPRLKPV
jgi:potassium efflux system protein